MRSYKTKAGTSLPIMDLRGKDYLEIKWRIVWFREDHPDWSIETEFVSVTDKSSMAKATVKNAEGRVIATGHKYEDMAGFPDFREKSETSAIGRALALIGYGTQFCADELDEGDRVVDGPVARKAAIAKPAASPGNVAVHVVKAIKPAVSGSQIYRGDPAKLTNPFDTDGDPFL